jgi:hypothetical protein
MVILDVKVTQLLIVQVELVMRLQVFVLAQLANLVLVVLKLALWLLQQLICLHALLLLLPLVVQDLLLIVILLLQPHWLLKIGPL